MKRLFSVLVATLVLGGAAIADPIEDREALMKSFGQSMGQLAPIAKGEKAFDAAEVQTILATLNERAMGFDPVALFPEGSTNAETTAAPAIWTDNAAFVAAAEKFKSDVAAAAANPPADLAGLQATMGAVGSNCGDCHQTFRIKK